MTPIANPEKWKRVMAELEERFRQALGDELWDWLCEEVKGDQKEVSEMIEVKNAIIEDAIITNDDHGLLSSWIYLDYGGSGQGFGGYALYLPTSFTHHNLKGPNYAGHFIWRVMEVAGVSKWSQLKGKTIRVQCEHSKVRHIVKDDWFSPSEDFRAMEGE